MTENGSGSLPFESPEQENTRLLEENAHRRRLLAVHGIPIPQPAPENPPPTKPSRRRRRWARRSAPEKESRYFEACFAGEKMSRRPWHQCRKTNRGRFWRPEATSEKRLTTNAWSPCF